MNASTDCSGVIGMPISVSSPASTRLEIASESTRTPSQSKMTARDQRTRTAGPFSSW